LKLKDFANEDENNAEEASSLMVDVNVNGRILKVPTLYGEHVSHMNSNNEEKSDERLFIMLRYAEYSVTSPLLLVSIFSLVVADGPLWAYHAALTGMIVCNLNGVLLHYFWACTSVKRGFFATFASFLHFDQWYIIFFL
jgi:hypothetical protein